VLAFPGLLFMVFANIQNAGLRALLPERLTQLPYSIILTLAMAGLGVGIGYIAYRFMSRRPSKD
jgi:glycopeptide antibiotics resistance protein